MATRDSTHGDQKKEERVREVKSPQQRGEGRPKTSEEEQTAEQNDEEDRKVDEDKHTQTEKDVIE